MIVAVSCMLPISAQFLTGVFSNANFESTPQTTTHELVDVIVTCPTEYDAAILRRLQADDSPPWHFIATPDKSGTILISDASNDRHR